MYNELYRSDTLKGHEGGAMLEYIILGVLCREALTGYDIRKRIEGGIGMFYKASFGSIYPLLAKLASQGYVEYQEVVTGKKRTKSYTITAEGKEYFQHWLESDEIADNSMEAFMSKVFFFDHLSIEVATSKIDSYQQRLIQYHEQLVEKKKSFEQLPHQDNFYYKLSTLYFGICKLQGIIEWCETVKERRQLERLVMYATQLGGQDAKDTLD